MAPGDILWTSVLAVHFALAVAAIVQIVRGKELRGFATVAWTLIVLIIPFVGSLAWFAYDGHLRRGAATDANI